jgi:hypothetical protein
MAKPASRCATNAVDVGDKGFNACGIIGFLAQLAKLRIVPSIESRFNELVEGWTVYRAMSQRCVPIELVLTVSVASCLRQEPHR